MQIRSQTTADFYYFLVLYRPINILQLAGCELRRNNTTAEEIHVCIFSVDLLLFLLVIGGLCQLFLLVI